MGNWKCTTGMRMASYNDINPGKARMRWKYEDYFTKLREITLERAVTVEVILVLHLSHSL